MQKGSSFPQTGVRESDSPEYIKLGCLLTLCDFLCMTAGWVRVSNYVI